GARIRKLWHRIMDSASPVSGAEEILDSAGISSGSVDHLLKVWDLASGTELATLAGHVGAIMRVTLSPDGTRAISISRDHVLKVWNITTGTELATMRSHAHTGITITPDSKRAIFAFRKPIRESSSISPRITEAVGPMCRVLDLTTGVECAPLRGH